MFHDRRSKRRPLPPRSLPSHRLVSRLLFPKPLFTTLYLSYTLSEHTVGEESPSMTAIMNGHATLPSYAEQFDAFRKHDAARDTLIQDVIRAYEELQLKYTEKCDDYSNEVESRRMWQSKASLNERALNEHRQISVRRLRGCVAAWLHHSPHQTRDRYTNTPPLLTTHRAPTRSLSP